MKRMFSLLTFVMTMLSSVSLFAQNQGTSDYEEEILRYEGQWPNGEGVLYSSRDGLIIGSFRSGVPEGRCICYKPNGEVYWGEYKKGKATGNGRLYRDNGIVFAGGFKNGSYHGMDTLYRSNGSVFIGKFRRGILKTRIMDSGTVPVHMKGKPDYPRIDLNRKQEDFLRELELRWEERNLRLIRGAGFITPRFQGGNVDDFALWANSRVVVPESFDPEDGSRTVLVEFTVMPDGTLNEVRAVFGSNPDLNEAAVKAVSKSPAWEPGVFNGERKSTRLTVPIVFEGEE